MPNLVNKKKLFLWIGIIILILILFGNEGMRNTVRQKIELSKLRKKLASIEEENRKLRKRLYRLEHDPAYIEREARIKLGLIQPGEKKYKFIKKE
ncbi:MAG: septum formation initiator family protein [Elusimicrobia bacterium]|nr:septum formation initiator family protein [Elusimicrobiota bacterium]